MCIFSKYRNFFGVPKEGVHRWRFMGVAIVDYLLTLAVAVLTTYISHIPLVLSTIGWFSLGIFFHIIFGVQTDVIKKLGIKC